MSSTLASKHGGVVADTPIHAQRTALAEFDQARMRQVKYACLLEKSVGDTVPEE